ncbi:hypothetical protein HanPI659440_Chr12g0455661 [Helianthus annuus]|nr:hypothetical protein HanPI659440_Chr12g0455661 [Helianthus annuus]
MIVAKLKKKKKKVNILHFKHNNEVNGHGKWEEGKLGRVVVPVSADATQQEALSWLKNLKNVNPLETEHDH